MARWELCGSRNRFFSRRHLVSYQISVCLSRCSSAIRIWGWSKTCATFCGTRDLAKVAKCTGWPWILVAVCSFVPMGFQAWICFIRDGGSMLVIDLVPLSLTTTQSSIRGPLPCTAESSNFSQNIFVESIHDARLEGGFQRKFSENNDKTNVCCLIGAAGDFFWNSHFQNPILVHQTVVF